MAEGLADFLGQKKNIILAGDFVDDQWGLIVEHPTGLRWTAQVGGYACHHPVIEGFAFSLGISPILKLNAHFYDHGSKWNGWCCEGIDIETADFLDPLLPAGLRVDHNRLGEGQEAWIPIRGTLSPWAAANLGEVTGFLTWQNSD